MSTPQTQVAFFMYLYGVQSVLRFNKTKLLWLWTTEKNLSNMRHACRYSHSEGDDDYNVRQCR